MAIFELKFFDCSDLTTTIEVHQINGIISIYSLDQKQTNTSGVCIHLDKSTAIKFAKTLRTEINKITDGEAN